MFVFLLPETKRKKKVKGEEDSEDEQRSKSDIIFNEELNDELKKAWVNYNLTSCLLTKGRTDSVLSIMDAQINKVEDKQKSRELYLRLVLTKAIVAVLGLQS